MTDDVRLAGSGTAETVEGRIRFSSKAVNMRFFDSVAGFRHDVHRRVERPATKP